MASVITTLDSNRFATTQVTATLALQALSLHCFYVSTCLSLAAGKACMVPMTPTMATWTFSISTDRRRGCAMPHVCQARGPLPPLHPCMFLFIFV